MDIPYGWHAGMAVDAPSDDAIPLAFQQGILTRALSPREPGSEDEINHARHYQTVSAEQCRHFGSQRVCLRREASFEEGRGPVSRSLEKQVGCRADKR